LNFIPIGNSYCITMFDINIKLNLGLPSGITMPTSWTDPMTPYLVTGGVLLVTLIVYIVRIKCNTIARVADKVSKAVQGPGKRRNVVVVSAKDVTPSSSVGPGYGQDSRVVPPRVADQQLNAAPGGPAPPVHTRKPDSPAKPSRRSRNLVDSQTEYDYDDLPASKPFNLPETHTRAQTGRSQTTGGSAAPAASNFSPTKQRLRNRTAAGTQSDTLSTPLKEKPATVTTTRTSTKKRPPRPSEYHMWIDAYTKKNGTTVGGHWRKTNTVQVPKRNSDYDKWVSAYTRKDGTQVSGYWRRTNTIQV
jgi:hypothetical protein